MSAAGAEFAAAREAGTTVVTGTVQRGDQRGRLLGFPTINLPVSAPIDEGVYAGTARIGGGSRSFVAAVSVGRRETYYAHDGQLLLEAFLLDFSDDVYGSPVTVELHRFLRPQRRFRGTDALIRHLRSDVRAVRRWAVGAGFAALLASSDPAQPRAGRWGPDERRRPRETAGAASERDARRLALVRRAVAAAEDAVVDHEYVATWTGLPLGYVQWLYPTVESLRALAADAR